MTDRRVPALLVVALVLTALRIVVGLATAGDGREPKLPAFAEGLSAEGIGTIALEPAGGETLVLERVGPDRFGLRLGGDLYPAHSGRVRSLMERILELTPSRIASEAPPGGDVFGLAPGQADRVAVADLVGHLAFELYLGSSTEGGDQVFARRRGDPHVYVVPGNLVFHVTRPAPFFGELRLFPAGLRVADVTGVEVLGPPGSSMRGGASRERLEAALGDLFALEAEDFYLGDLSTAVPSTELGLRAGGSVDVVVQVFDIEGDGDTVAIQVIGGATTGSGRPVAYRVEIDDLPEVFRPPGRQAPPGP